MSENLDKFDKKIKDQDVQFERRSAVCSILPIYPPEGFSIMDDVISALVKKIADEKEKVIQMRLRRLRSFNVELDLKEESQRKFPRIKCEILGGHTETWWYNDGTPSGIRLISFVQDKTIKDTDFNTFKTMRMAVDIKYY